MKKLGSIGLITLASLSIFSMKRLHDNSMTRIDERLDEQKMKTELLIKEGLEYSERIERAIEASDMLLEQSDKILKKSCS